MGTLLLSEIRDEVTEGLGNRTELTTANYNRFINLSYLHVSRPAIHPHYELRQSENITLLAATRAYPYDTSWRGTRSLYNSTLEYLLHPEDIQDQDARSVTTVARPSHYAIEGINIVLSQIPNADAAGDVLVHRYWQRPILLVADGDTTVISPDWDEVIIAGALYRGWRRLNQHERMVEAREDYARLIREVQDEEKLFAKSRGWRATPQIVDHLAR
jgi:hypothetical protein